MFVPFSFRSSADNSKIGDIDNEDILPKQPAYQLNAQSSEFSSVVLTRKYCNSCFRSEYFESN
jgi:hypothetical protein